MSEFAVPENIKKSAKRRLKKPSREYSGEGQTPVGGEPALHQFNIPNIEAMNAKVEQINNAHQREFGYNASAAVQHDLLRAALTPDSITNLFTNRVSGLQRQAREGLRSYDPSEAVEDDFELYPNEVPLVPGEVVPIEFKQREEARSKLKLEFTGWFHRLPTDEELNQILRGEQPDFVKGIERGIAAGRSLEGLSTAPKVTTQELLLRASQYRGGAVGHPGLTFRDTKTVKEHAGELAQGVAQKLMQEIADSNDPAAIEGALLELGVDRGMLTEHSLAAAIDLTNWGEVKDEFNISDSAMVFTGAEVQLATFGPSFLSEFDRAMNQFMLNIAFIPAGIGLILYAGGSDLYGVARGDFGFSKSREFAGAMKDEVIDQFVNPRDHWGDWGFTVLAMATGGWGIAGRTTAGLRAVRRTGKSGGAKFPGGDAPAAFWKLSWAKRETLGYPQTRPGAFLFGDTDTHGIRSGGLLRRPEPGIEIIGGEVIKFSDNSFRAQFQAVYWGKKKQKMEAGTARSPTNIDVADSAAHMPGWGPWSVNNSVARKARRRAVIETDVRVAQETRYLKAFRRAQKQEAGLRRLIATRGTDPLVVAFADWVRRWHPTRQDPDLVAFAKSLENDGHFEGLPKAKVNTLALQRLMAAELAAGEFGSRRLLVEQRAMHEMYMKNPEETATFYSNENRTLTPEQVELNHRVQIMLIDAAINVLDVGVPKRWDATIRAARDIGNDAEDWKFYAGALDDQNMAAARAGAEITLVEEFARQKQAGVLVLAEGSKILDDATQSHANKYQVVEELAIAVGNLEDRLNTAQADIAARTRAGGKVPKRMLNEERVAAEKLGTKRGQYEEQLGILTRKTEKLDITREEFAALASMQGISLEKFQKDFLDSVEIMSALYEWLPDTIDPTAMYLKAQRAPFVSGSQVPAGAGALRSGPGGVAGPSASSIQAAMSAHYRFKGDSFGIGDRTWNTPDLLISSRRQALKMVGKIDEWERAWDNSVATPGPGLIALRPPSEVNEAHRLMVRAVQDQQLDAAMVRGLKDSDIEDLSRTLFPGEVDKNGMLMMIRDDGTLGPVDMAGMRFVHPDFFLENPLAPATVGKSKGRDFIQNVLNIGNEPIKDLTLFLRLSYASNFIAAGLMGTIHSGFLAYPNMIRAAMSTKFYGEENAAFLRGAMGEARSDSYIIERTSVGSTDRFSQTADIITTGSDQMRRGWNLATDQKWREGALLHEAAAAGFRGNEGLTRMRLLFDGKAAREAKAAGGDVLKKFTADKQRAIGAIDAAKTAMIRFDDLAGWEKNFARHLFFIWAFQTRAGKWAIDTMLDRPIQIEFLINAGDIKEDEITELIGEVPAWFKRMGAYVVGADSNGRPGYRNVGQLFAGQSLVEAGYLVGGLIRGDLRVGAVRELLGPVGDVAMTAATGVDKWGRPESPQSATVRQFEETPPGAVFTRRGRKDEEVPDIKTAREQLAELDIRDPNALKAARQAATDQRTILVQDNWDVYGPMAYPQGRKDVHPDAMAARNHFEQSQEEQLLKVFADQQKVLTKQSVLLRETVPGGVKRWLSYKENLALDLNESRKENGNESHVEGTISHADVAMETLIELGFMRPSQKAKWMALFENPKDAHKLGFPEVENPGEDFGGKEVLRKLEAEFAGGEENSAWRTDVKTASQFRERYNEFAPALNALKVIGVSGYTQPSAVTEAHRDNYGRRFNNWKKSKAHFHTKPKTMSKAEIALLNERGRRWLELAGNSGDVTIGDSEFPSFEAMEWALKAKTARDVDIASWAQGSWGTLSAFQKQVAGRKVTPGIQQAWNRLNVLIEDGHRDTGEAFTQEQLNEMLTSTVPGFFDDYKFSQLSKPERFLKLRSFTENKDVWARLLDTDGVLVISALRGWIKSRDEDLLDLTEKEQIAFWRGGEVWNHETQKLEEVDGYIVEKVLPLLGQVFDGVSSDPELKTLLLQHGGVSFLEDIVG